MNRPAAKTTTPAQDYPPATHGSRVAARGRHQANKMTAAQREEYFRQGIVLNQGGRLPDKPETSSSDSYPVGADVRRLGNL
jgi:hypothetical protein